MPPDYITRSAFARLAKVSPAAVTKACKRQLKPACVRDRVDPKHPAAVAYLALHKRASEEQTKPQRTANGQNRDATATLVAAVVHDESNLGAYADLTIREIVNQFGSERVFMDWLEAHKKIEDVEEKRIKNMELRGELIRRDLVTRTVFSAWENSNRRLLNDVPRTLVARLYAAALSGIPKEEAEQSVKDVISGILRLVKESAEKNLEPDV